MFNKLRYQLLLIFIFFSSILIGLTIINHIYIKQKNRLERIHLSVLNINNLILKDAYSISSFFTYDTKNPSFFETGNSEFLNEQLKNIMQIRKGVEDLNNLEGIQQFDIISRVKEINDELDIYTNDLNRIVRLILKRGYKDHGVEGKMRDYIHQLEDIESVDLSKVLMLRRHEKDYIIRNEPVYIQKLTKLAKEFRNEIKNDNHLSKSNKDSSLYYLDNYVSYFNLMVELDQQIGIKNNSALRHKIHLQSNKIINIINLILSETTIKKDRYFKQIKQYYVISTVGLILLSILLSFQISKRITKNLSSLARNISNFVSSGFNKDYGDNFPGSYPKDEIGLLIDNYKILRTEILSLINEFQQKVEQRTKAVQCQKDKIELQKEEIESQRDELFRKNQLIEYQKEKTEQQNKDIISSIQYARLIQDALMPSKETLSRYFPDNFILYKPKDIISGDFYWAKRIKNANYDISLVAVVDCTGHGVPGALMSMLGVAFLNEIILKKEINSASQILDKLREKVIESFQSHLNGNITHDGMDIALVLIDHKSNYLQFTGANRPLYLIRDKNLNIIYGDKMPIGKHGISKGNFKNNIIDIKENDIIYLLSDGYADQFGGQKNKKFKRQRLRDLLLNIHENPMPVQKEILESEHEKWRGYNRQTDDILIMGIRL